MPKKAIYPGTFDPITLGHLDIISRALNIADTLIIAVAIDSSKTPLFSVEERTSLTQDALKHVKLDSDRIQVIPFDGLLANFATEQQANIIIRGLRAVSDFEFEFQMSCMNAKLAPNIETIFLPASESKHFIASRFVKEIAKLGGNISEWVTPNVVKQLNEIK